MNLFFPRVRCGKWVGNVVVDQTLRATTPQRIERRGSSGAHSRIGSYCPKELRKMERVEQAGSSGGCNPPLEGQVNGLSGWGRVLENQES